MESSRFFASRIFNRPFLILSFLFIGWRLAFLLLVHPLYLTPSTEEIQRGSIALTLLKTMDLRILWQHRPDDYAGGYYLNTFLTAIFFKFFSINGFVLKLPPLVFSLGAFWVWWVILQKWVSRKAAIFFGILSSFPMFYILSFDVNNLGDHAETRFFSALTVFFYLKVREAKSSWGDLAALGFVSGFGTWFAYIFALTPAAICLHILWEKKVTRRSSWGILVGFFCLGFAPWIVTNIVTRGAGFFIQENSLWNLMKWEHFQPSILLDPKQNLFGRTFRSLDYYDDTLKVQIICQLVRSIASFGLIIYAGFLWFQKTRFRAPSSPMARLVFIYSILFIFAAELYAEGGVRFWVPFRSFFVVGVAVILSSLSQRLPTGKATRLTLVSVSVMVASGIVSTISRMDYDLRGSLFQRRGHAAFEVVQDIKDLYATKPYRKEFHLQDVRYGFDFFYDQDRADLLDPKRAEEYLKKANETAVRSFCYFGGRWLASNSVKLEEARDWMEYLINRDPEAERIIKIGILHGKSMAAIDPEETLETVLKEVFQYGEQSEEAWSYGGKKCAQIWLRENFSIHYVGEQLSLFLKQVPSDKASAFCNGVGSHLLHRYALGEGALLNWAELQSFPRETLASIMIGIKTCCYRKDILCGLERRSGVCWVLTDISSKLPDDLKKVLESAPEHSLEFLSPKSRSSMSAMLAQQSGV